MRIRAGYEIVYHCPQKTPMILKVHVHYSRARDIVVPDHLNTDPLAPVTAHRDVYGNWCSRIVAPIGRIRLSGNVVIDDTGEPDVVAAGAQQHKVRDLPEETLSFLLGSRYCETDLLSEAAWRLFLGHAPRMEPRPGDCDDVHKHIVFGYGDARSTRTAFESFQECKRVCRDFAHLAIAFCCCMNIPARYCTGYLGDTGTLHPTGSEISRRGLKPTWGPVVYIQSSQQRAARWASADRARP
jgi:transglutaminase-like putative cysteine protease